MNEDTKEIKVHIGLKPWYPKLIDATKNSLAECIEAGMPNDLAKDIAKNILENALARAIEIGFK